MPVPMSMHSEHPDHAHRRHGHQPRYDGPRGPQRTGGGIPDSLLLGVLAFLLGLSLFVWTATGLAGLFAHGAWPDGVSFTHTPLAIRELVTEPHNLRDAWPSTPHDQLPGYGLFWGIFISQLMVLMVLTIFAMGTVARARAVRASRKAQAQSEVPAPREESTHPTEQPPQAQERPPQKPSPASAPAVAPDGPGTAPDAAQPRPDPTAPAEPTDPARGPVPSPVPILGTGTGTGTDIGSGTGAGRQPEPSTEPAPGATPDPVTRVLEAPGAALVAARTPALWAATKTARAKLGPVLLFDPTLACDTPDRLRWSPHHGCADRATAASRATALLDPLRSPRPIDATVHTMAETILRCWLHAAALADRPFREVHRWALAKAPASEPVQTLRTHPKASSGSAGELEAALAGHPQLRGDATELIRRALAPLSQLHVRNACTSARTDRISLESFIHETGTLYVVGEDPDVMPILNALTQSVVEHGRRMAARSSAGRLDPPLTSVLELREP